MKRLALFSAAAVIAAIISGCGGSSGGSSGGASSSSLGANETAAAIPVTIAGTYTLTFTESNAGSGIADGTVTVFEIKSDGSMTIDNGRVLTSPVNYRGNPQEAIWFDYAANLSYALSSLTTGFNEINVGTDVHYDEASFVFYGQYRGQSGSSSSAASSSSSSVAASSSSSLSSASSSSSSVSSASSSSAGAGALALWQRTDDNNKVIAPVTYQGIAASGPQIWDEAEVDFICLASISYSSDANCSKTLVSSSDTKVVWDTEIVGSLHAGTKIKMTFEKMGDANASAYLVSKQLKEPSYTPPAGLTGLVGTYHVADTAAPELFGSIVSGHMSLDLTIGADGSVHYIAKDIDDNSTVRNVTTGWDGEKDQCNTAENTIMLDKWSLGGRVSVVKVRDWFEFHVYMPLYVQGIGNRTTDIQWNVPYNP